MINNIKVSNFQSHKNTELELHEGVNCIIGSTDSGKSALLKALYWLIYNRPQGYSFASHWILDDKGNIKNTVAPIDCTIRVAIEKPNNVAVTRSRADDTNHYVCNGIPYEALRGDVPAEIQKALNITDVNIQKQMDAPFLLSESAGEVARFFNRVVNLDKIDIVLKAAEASKRKNKSEIQNTDNEIQELNEELKEYDWIEEAEKLVNRLGILQEKKDSAYTDMVGIREDIYRQDKAYSIIEKTESIQEVEELLKKLESLGIAINAKKIRFDYLNNTIARYNLEKECLTESKNLNEAEKLIIEIEKLNNDLYETDDLHFTFTNQLQKVNTNVQHVGMYTKEIEILEKQLPNTCPTCGQIVESWSI